MTQTPTRQLVAAEMIGTFVLVLLGCGALVMSTWQVDLGGYIPTMASVGLTFGLALTVMTYAVGRISGAHLNPAVSVGAALGGRVAWNQVPVYIAAQLGGAILAAAVLFGLMQGYDGFVAEGNMGQNGFGDQSPGDYALWAALLLELVMTMIFVWVILAVTDERNQHPALAPLAIGFTLAAIHFVTLNATGTSVNPARSIGPALFAGTDAIAQLWLFVVAPLLGGSLAGVGYAALFGQQQWAADQQPAAAATTTGGWSEHQWTPEQIAAWEAQQVQQAHAQAWTPEQIAAWEAQQSQASTPPPDQPGRPGQQWPDEGHGERTQIRPPR